MANFPQHAIFDNSLGVLAFVVSFTVALYTFYQYLLPKPLPGIPCNPEALNSLLGDVPDLLRDDRGAMDWLLEQSRRHQAPLFQVFLRPLSKPFVVLSDFREAEDVLMRRNEWDRSDYSIDLLGGQAPHHHINQKTGPVWKGHRHLIQDLMQPKFLNQVAAPNIYSSTLDLIHLWTEKGRLACGQPFDAEQDIFYASLDAVLEFSFGASFPHRAIPPQRECMESLESSDLGSNMDGSVDFPSQAVHETITATLRASEVVGELVEAPFPRLSWWFKSWMPTEAQHVRTRHKYIKEQILSAVDRLESEKAGTDDAWIKSAVDVMMQREQMLANKEGRYPVYWSPAMRDEVFGFVIGGHDTLSTTILWGLKFLSDCQYAQWMLRRDLREAHPEAYKHKRMPTADEITTNSAPYLDATIHEILRLASSIAVLDRQATCDTELLGHHIPKGTIVMMLNRGPSFTEPGLPIKEILRSQTSRAAALRNRGQRIWVPGNEDMFIPGRWLAASERHRCYPGIPRAPSCQNLNFDSQEDMGKRSITYKPTNRGVFKILSANDKRPTQVNAGVGKQPEQHSSVESQTGKILAHLQREYLKVDAKPKEAPQQRNSVERQPGKLLVHLQREYLKLDAKPKEAPDTLTSSQKHPPLKRDAKPKEAPDTLTAGPKLPPQDPTIRKDFRINSDTLQCPSLPFGLGKRGCYGRKLAMLELRIVFTLLIWRFELGKCPDELSGYGAVETLTHKPKQCFVSLKRLDEE